MLKQAILNSRYAGVALICAICAVSAAGMNVPAAAEASPSAKQTPGDEILARVDGIAIRASDLDFVEKEITSNITNLPPVARRRLLVEYLIDNHLFAAMAKQKNLEETDGFKRRMTYYRTRALREMLFEKEVKGSISEKLAKALYEERVESLKDEKEVRARHILLPTQAEAVDVLKKVTAGGDFAALAKEYSIDSRTKTRGGDLGFFGRGRMVSELEKAAFSLTPGQVKGPVKSDYGFHIVKLEEQRDKPVPNFEDVRNEIMTSLMQQRAQNVAEGLRTKAKIEFVEPELKKFVELSRKKAEERRAEIEKKMKAQIEQMEAAKKSGKGSDGQIRPQ